MQEKKVSNMNWSSDVNHKNKNIKAEVDLK